MGNDERNQRNQEYEEWSDQMAEFLLLLLFVKVSSWIIAHVVHNILSIMISLVTVGLLDM